MSSLLKIIMTLLVVLASVPAAADTVTQVGGKTSSVYYFTGIYTHTDDSTCFEFEMLEDNKLRSLSAEDCDSTLFTRVEFREINDTGEAPGGRIAHLTIKPPPGTNGESPRYLNTTVVSAELTPSGWVFQVRRSSSRASEKPTPIPASLIENIEFAPPPIEVQSEDPEFTRKKISELRNKIVNEISSKSISQDATEGPPNQQGQQPGQPPSDSSAESYLDTNENQEVRELSPEEDAEMRRQRALAGNPTSGLEELILAEEARRKSPNNNALGIPKSNPFSFASMGGIYVFVVMLSISLTSFSAGTIIMKIAAQINGIKDLTTFRAMGAAFLMGFVPPVLFLIAYWLIPLFIGLKIFVGGAAFFFSGRMIIMGLLDITEGKATEVLVTYYGGILCILSLGWVYFKYAGK